jgi:murein DD-endopeptidase MepM/ murein hydrolase activator NlpD
VEAVRRRLVHRSGGAATDPRDLAGGLTLYAYTPQPEEDLLSLAARCSIPYAGLASLNRLAHPDELAGTPSLLLPSVPGIFIPEKPSSDLERLLGASHAGEEGVELLIRRGGRTETFRFIPGGDFSAAERVFFLNRGFRFPLNSFTLTSAFGPRINPVTGVYRNHQGIDLAAPEGTEVYAVREGEVIDMGEDAVYGRYIIIRHGEDWVSLYGHLSKTETALHSAVRSGSLIGRVGSTGQSTGPHLHFELRRNGQAQDPGRYLRIFKTEGL